MIIKYKQSLKYILKKEKEPLSLSSVFSMRKTTAKARRKLVG